MSKSEKNFWNVAPVWLHEQFLKDVITHRTIEDCIAMGMSPLEIMTKLVKVKSDETRRFRDAEFERIKTQRGEFKLGES